MEKETKYSRFDKRIRISEKQLDWINSRKGTGKKDTAAAYLDKIINFWKKNNK